MFQRVKWKTKGSANYSEAAYRVPSSRACNLLANIYRGDLRRTNYTCTRETWRTREKKFKPLQSFSWPKGNVTRKAWNEWGFALTTSFVCSGFKCQILAFRYNRKLFLPGPPRIQGAITFQVQLYKAFNKILPSQGKLCSTTEKRFFQ